MQTHEAKVPILHRLCYRNSNVRIFTVPETSIIVEIVMFSTSILLVSLTDT